MDAYARAPAFLHALVGTGRGVEAFELRDEAHVPHPDLATRDPGARLRVIGQRCDWGSGTRIGASLKEFNDLYGRRASRAAPSS